MWRQALGTWRAGVRDIQKHPETIFASNPLTTGFGQYEFGSGTKVPTAAN